MLKFEFKYKIIANSEEVFSYLISLIFFCRFLVETTHHREFVYSKDFIPKPKLSISTQAQKVCFERHLEGNMNPESLGNQSFAGGDFWWDLLKEKMRKSTVKLEKPVFC